MAYSRRLQYCMYRIKLHPRGYVRKTKDQVLL